MVIKSEQKLVFVGIPALYSGDRDGIGAGEEGFVAVISCIL
jgi:hypothetical protein